MIKDPFFKRLLTILFALTLVIVIWKLRIIILYVILASLLSVLLHPLKNKIQKLLPIKRSSPLSNTISTIITIILFFCGFITFFVTVIPYVYNNLEKISYEQISNISIVINDFLSHNLGKYYESNAIKDLINIDKIIELVIPKTINILLISIPQFFIGTGIVIFISFFLLKKPRMIRYIIISVAKKKIASKILYSFDSINNILRKYLYGVIIQLSIIVILYTVSMTIIGMKGAFSIAIIVAMFNLIPYLGPIIGGVITILFCLVTNSHLEQEELFFITSNVVIFFVIIQLIDGMISQPFIFSKVVKAHPLEIFLVILSSSYLIGIVGMIFAVPSYAVLRIIAREFLSRFRVVQLITKNIK